MRKSIPLKNSIFQIYENKLKRRFIMSFEQTLYCGKLHSKLKKKVGYQTF